MPSLKDLLADDDELTRRSAEGLAERFGVPAGRAAVKVYVPGRVEFIGRHTDYAGGRSIVLAVGRGFRMVAAAREDKLLRLGTGPDGADAREFAYGQSPTHPPGDWVNYAATVARRVAMNFAGCVDLRGMDAVFVSDLPVAAGMSSSSALMVMVFLAISAINRLDETGPYRREIHCPLELAEYLGCIENGQTFRTLAGEVGVGTFGGSEDHTAMLCCKAETVSQFSYAPSAFERDVPFPAGVDLVIGTSGVQAVKTAEAMELYNLVSARAAKAAAAYNAATGARCGHLRAVVEHAGPGGLMDALEAIGKGAGGADADLDLTGRYEQFYRADQEIVPAFGDALDAKDLDALGPMSDASHAGADRGLRNQIPQTNFLQRSARRLGAIAASAFGAGFGGSVWAMIGKDSSEQFRADWQRRYAEEFPAQADEAEFFITRPGPRARVAAD